jgi:dihydroneopterin aldolase
MNIALQYASVSLEGLEFFAYHGFYEEERKIGNRYSLDITVEAVVTKAAENDTLQHTINYEILYQIAAEVMKTPTLLLEHIAYQIIQKIFAAFSTATIVEVVVRKHNPPIGGVCNASKIVLKMQREH